MQNHKWPIRQFFEPRDRIGMTTEPAGHDTEGNPLYTVYETTTCEERVLTEAETIDLIAFLENPNRGFYE